MKPKYGVCMVVRDRWPLTHQTLQSMMFSDQRKDSYDLFVISNGSSKETNEDLKDFFRKGLLPLKNLFIIPKEVPISTAYNLGFMMAKEYPILVKMDNDLIVSRMATPRVKITNHQPADAVGGTNPGAPVSAGIIRGLGHAQSVRRRHQTEKNSVHEDVPNAWLDNMAEAIKRMEVGIAALVPVSPGESFMTMHNAVIRARYHGCPYLFGACMSITQDTFQKLGYFDERLSRKVDIDYTMRAAKALIRIGYHPDFGVGHIGAQLSTETPDERQKRVSMANSIIDQSQANGPLATMWRMIDERLHRASQRNTFLNVTGIDKLLNFVPANADRETLDMDTAAIQ